MGGNMPISIYHDSSDSIGFIFLIKFEHVNSRYYRDVLVSGGERLGLLHRSLGQDGVDALRVRQLQVSSPGRQVVNPPPPSPTGCTEVVKDVHDYVFNQIFWCVRSFYKKKEMIQWKSAIGTWAWQEIFIIYKWENWPWHYSMWFASNLLKFLS